MYKDLIFPQEENFASHFVLSNLEIYLQFYLFLNKIFLAIYKLKVYVYTLGHKIILFNLNEISLY